MAKHDHDHDQEKRRMDRTWFHVRGQCAGLHIAQLTPWGGAGIHLDTPCLLSVVFPSQLPVVNSSSDAGTPPRTSSGTAGASTGRARGNDSRTWHRSWCGGCACPCLTRPYLASNCTGRGAPAPQSSSRIAPGTLFPCRGGGAQRACYPMGGSRPVPCSHPQRVKWTRSW